MTTPVNCSICGKEIILKDGETARFETSYSLAESGEKVSTVHFVCPVCKEKERIKIGDQVRIIAPKKPFINGLTGKIIGVTVDQWKVQIKDEDNKLLVFPFWNLHPWEVEKL